MYGFGCSTSVEPADLSIFWDDDFLDSFSATFGLFFYAYYIKASVKAIKEGSTPLPVLAEASKMERPVLLVNSKMSSSLTCLSGILPS